MVVTFSQNLERTLQHAASVAREQSREHAAPEDLLIALIDDDEDASNAMRALLIDPKRLRRDIAAYMEGAVDDPDGNVSVGPNYTADLRRILQLAVVQAQSSGRRVVTGADLLLELFTEPVGHFLQQQGATRYDAVSYLSHGGPDAGSTRPAATSDAASPERAVNDGGAGDWADLEIFLLNDEYTPMEFVVWVLQEVFGLGREDAIRVMLSTHNQGRGSCGVFGWAEAAELAERMEKLAREHQHPLSCMMRPAPNPSASPPAATPDQ